MKFQIQKVLIDDAFHELSYPIRNSKNVFTILVGRNAVGKTRTLSKITNHYIFQKDLFADPQELITSYNSDNRPDRVIAVSNSRFDRFPDPNNTFRQRKYLEIDYHYLGLGSFRSSTYSIISKGCEAILSGFGRDEFKKRNLAEILEYTGFLPIFNIEFRQILRPDQLRDSPSDILRDEYFQRKYLGEYQNIDNINIEKEIMPGLRYLKDRVNYNKALSFRINLLDEYRHNYELEEFALYIAPLLKAGLVKISRISLFDKKSKNKIPFHQASSGQQCMILMFLGITGVISNKSLICIDEPEISLHPRWQAEFIGILQKIFSPYHGCHFLIATHSPQIVAGLVSENGYVADIENKKLLHSSEYAKKSADFQLTEIFHEPGFRNEYLIRNLLIILSKLSKNDKLSSEDLQKLSDFEKIKIRLDDSDPVYHLLNQIKMLVG